MEFSVTDISISDYQYNRVAAKLARTRRHYKAAAKTAAKMVEAGKDFAVYDDKGVMVMQVFSTGRYVIDAAAHGTQVNAPLHYIAAAIDNARRS